MVAPTASLTIARVRTLAFLGLEVADVDAEVQLSSGLPSFTIVGLPDKAVAESRERVRAALGAMGLALPPRRIIVNLAPADLAKEGSHFDLPIALGVLIVMGVLPVERSSGIWCWASWRWTVDPRGFRRAAGGGGGGRARHGADLPRSLRRRGGLAQGPGRDPGRAQPAGADQPRPRRAAPAPARAADGRRRSCAIRTCATSRARRRPSARSRSRRPAPTT